MAYWLIKSEPGTWSWDDQVKAGAKGTAWEGVRNHQAKQNLMKMKRGDRAFFYHSGEEKRVMGTVDVIGEYRPDPSDKTGAFGLVDFKAGAPLRSPSRSPNAGRSRSSRRWCCSTIRACRCSRWRRTNGVRFACWAA